MSTREIVGQTGVIFVLRAGLFFICRGYLLKSLYHDLQHLSDAGGHAKAASLDGSAEVELDSLPTPATTPKHDKTSFPIRRRPLHSTLSRGCFALCFAESCLLFVLLMCQGLGYLDPWTRMLNWRISLSLLMLTILVFVPLSVSLSLASRSSSASGEIRSSRSATTRVLLTLAPVAFYLFFLSYIPLPSALKFGMTDFTKSALARLTVLGTIILGLLSGFGAVSNAWAFFPTFTHSNKEEPTEAQITLAEQSLARVKRDLEEKQLQQARRDSVQPQAESSWLSRVVPNFRGESKLSQEMQGLEALESHMSRDLDSLRKRHADARFSSTVVGRIIAFGGRIFAIYCVFKIFSSLVNILLPMRAGSGRSSPDLIASVLRTLSAFPPSERALDEHESAALSRQISLALVGLIILSTIRLVLRGVARVLRVSSRSLGASLMLLVLAQLMGMYFLSTVVQIRTSFPPPAPKTTLPPQEVANPQLDASILEPDYNVFSTIPEFQVFGLLFDWSFVLSAGGSALARWLDQRING